MMSLKTLSKLPLDSQLLIYIDKIFPHINAQGLYINEEAGHTIEIQIIHHNGESTDVSISREKLNQWVEDSNLVILPKSKLVEITDEQELHDQLLEQTFKDIEGNECSK